jgi:hypothetical protein
VQVYLGPYSHWFRPGQWYKDWVLWYFGFGHKVDYEKIDIVALDKVTEAIQDDWFYDKLMRIERWFDNRYKRKVRVKIHPYDVWSMDDTLGHIVLPMLILLREKKQGYPHVDDVDVPENLKSTSAPALTQAQIATACPDDNGAARWDWVLSEMIWAFEQINKDDADSEFFVGTYDREGYMKWQARKTRGFALFGKYFEALWD